VSFLSLAGNWWGHLEVVVADSAGVIHFFDPNGTERIGDAGGPLAGEVLSADIVGDLRPEALALRADGTLVGWIDYNYSTNGFPRFFPYGFAEAPAICDGAGRRFVAMTDTAGGLWSLPFPGFPGPAPWPAASGGGGRSRYLGFAESTPVRPTLQSLRWTWSGEDAGRLCWEGSGLSDLARLRIRVSEQEAALLESTPRDEGCATLSNRRLGERLLLEGQDRGGEWLELGALVLEPPTGLRVGLPLPNPFSAETRIDVTGARGPVDVQVLDLSGRVVWSRHSIASEITWSGINDSGRRVPAGLYFLRVSDAKQSIVRRVLRLD
jgi:hypothetical protein